MSFTGNLDAAIDALLKMAGVKKVDDQTRYAIGEGIRAGGDIKINKDGSATIDGYPANHPMFYPVTFDAGSSGVGTGPDMYTEAGQMAMDGYQIGTPNFSGVTSSVTSGSVSGDIVDDGCDTLLCKGKKALQNAFSVASPSGLAQTAMDWYSEKYVRTFFVVFGVLVVLLALATLLFRAGDSAVSAALNSDVVKTAGKLAKVVI